MIDRDEQTEGTQGQPDGSPAYRDYRSKLGRGNCRETRRLKPSRSHRHHGDVSGDSCP